MDQISGRASSFPTNGLSRGMEPLRLHAPFGDRAVALRDEERPVSAEHEPASEVLPRVELRALLVDDLHVIDPRRHAVHELAPRDRGVVHPVARLGIAPVDEPVRREVRVERDVEQPALPARVHRRQSRDGLGKRSVGRNDAQATWSLGHQHFPVRQERESPGVLQSLGHRDDIERDVRLSFGRVGLAGERGLLVDSVRRSRIHALRHERCGP
jgi:hypothetical protein